MKFDLAFGKTGLSVDLPDGFRYRKLDAHSAKALANPAQALTAALEKPIAMPGLEELARGKTSAAISVCDITRPAPNRQTLPPVLACLERAGIAARRHHHPDRDRPASPGDGSGDPRNLRRRNRGELSRGES